MQQINEAHTAEGVDPFQRKADVRALEEQLRNTATEYNMDATRFVGYGDAVASQAMQKEQAENALDATRRANGQRATIERLNGFMAKGDTTSLENALVTLEEDGQSTLAREYRSGMQTLADAEATRDDANRARSEEGNHNRALTEEEVADAKKYGIKVDAYPSIGAARSKINDQRVAEARASMTSKASKTIAVGVIEDMMPGILRELESEASNLDGLRFTPGDDGLADYINDELMDNEALIQEISAFVSAQGPQQGENAAARIRQLVLEDLARRTKGSDGFIEKMFGGGIEADIRTLSPTKSADSYL
jgi:sRNA-binding regulator protein Hfq